MLVSLTHSLTRDDQTTVGREKKNKKTYACLKSRKTICTIGDQSTQYASTLAEFLFRFFLETLFSFSIQPYAVYIYFSFAYQVWVSTI